MININSDILIDISQMTLSDLIDNYSEFDLIVNSQSLFLLIILLIIIIALLIMMIYSIVSTMRLYMRVNLNLEEDKKSDRRWLTYVDNLLIFLSGALLMGVIASIVISTYNPQLVSTTIKGFVLDIDSYEHVFEDGHAEHYYLVTITDQTEEQYTLVFSDQEELGQLDYTNKRVRLSGSTEPKWYIKKPQVSKVLKGSAKITDEYLEHYVFELDRIY